MNRNYNLYLKYLSFGLLSFLGVVMIIATILEKFYGTEFVISDIYCSPVIVGLWGVMAVASLLWMLKCKLNKRIITFLLHISFLIILSGAFVTHVSGEQGYIHLRKDGNMQKEYTLRGNSEVIKKLPFAMSLIDFDVKYYPGTNNPMDYVSVFSISDKDKNIKGEVSMNNIFEYKSFRFYQSSYDDDGLGTTFSISYDPYGIGITYLGYIMLLLSMILFIFDKKSRFRSLLKHPLLKSTIVLIFVLLPISAKAENQPKSLPQNVASEICDLYVYYNNRVCPLQTLAKDFTIKLYGEDSYNGLSYEQVFTGWMFFYDEWKEEPIIKIKDKAVREILGVKDDVYVRLTDYIDTHKGYKLDDHLRNQESKHWRAVNDANEKFNIISMVCTGNILKLFPYRPIDKNNIMWFSSVEKLPEEISIEEYTFITKIMDYINEKIVQHKYDDVIELLNKTKQYQQKKAGEDVLPDNLKFETEKIYNNFNFIKMLAMLCCTIGIISFIFYCRYVIVLRRRLKWLDISLNISALIIFVYLSLMIGCRWIISGHIPLANGFETMQFMAWSSLLLMFVLQHRLTLARPFAFLLCGLTLMVAMMGQANPQITLLMPVLSSPLLSIHVVVIMISYSLFAFIMFNGVTAVILRYQKKDCTEQIERLQLISRLMLYPAVFLLTIGVFIGAVWANVSWGRYWGWDPKEVWALITLLIYAMALHTDSIPKFRNTMFFHWFAILAFLSVLITYFGVNFILGGLHSYAG